METLNKGPFVGIGYADDAALLIKGIDPGTLVNLTNAKLDEVLRWGQGNGLSFSPQKTVAVMFTRKRVETREFLKMNGVKINLSKSVKYLRTHIHC